MNKVKIGMILIIILISTSAFVGCSKKDKGKQNELVDEVIDLQESRHYGPEDASNEKTKTKEAENQETKIKKTEIKTTNFQEPTEDYAIEKKTMKIYDIEEGYLEVPFNPNLLRHAYDWKKIEEQGGYKYYMEDGKAITKLGIDVSTFQGEIDWKQVKESGIEFVIIRLGFRGYGNGSLVLDKRYKSNIKSALKAGLDVGVYFFSQAITVEEAIEEANYVNQNLDGYEITYPVVFDTEKIKGDTARTDHLSLEELTDITRAFCEKVKEFGYVPMIYANSKWLTTKLELDQLEGYGIWYADYQEEPLYLYQFNMWQYTESGYVPGITGIVDINLYWELSK